MKYRIQRWVEHWNTKKFMGISNSYDNILCTQVKTLNFEIKMPNPSYCRLYLFVRSLCCIEVSYNTLQ